MNESNKSKELIKCINDLNAKLITLNDYIENANNYLNDIIVSGQSIDKEVLSKSKTNVNNMIDDLRVINNSITNRIKGGI